MHSKVILEKTKYDGSQLSSLWSYKNHDLQGDSIVAFIGPCEVKEHMVDLEDVKEKAFIFSNNMLHFIIEHFEMDLEKTILRQRMLISIINESLIAKGYQTRRTGDDIFIDDAKLSVSIATLSPVSSVIHTGLNVIGEGAPVKAIGLQDIGISDILAFAEEIVTKYASEMHDIALARCKVRGVL